MPLQYRVTTHRDRLPAAQILMVDGTVPGWTPGPGDRLWDHHRPGGPPIQIDDIPLPATTWIRDLADGRPQCIATTMLDADACCAAAWLQLPRERLAAPDLSRRLRAIAWDCDHLVVPPDLADLADFAAKVGAALKQSSVPLPAELGLPSDRQAWTQDHWQRYSSTGFERGTAWLLAAAQGDRPWPGENGEADAYWEQVERDRAWLRDGGRISFLETPTGAIAVADVRGLGRSLDPRAFYRALADLAPPAPLRPETLLRRDYGSGGDSYTLGSIPLHPRQSQLDYTAGIFAALTAAERRNNPAAEPWGGRKTVGGSGWNAPSTLTPEAIARAIDRPASDGEAGQRPRSPQGERP